jgi:multiple sugar transport system substrate-binding protein
MVAIGCLLVFASMMVGSPTYAATTLDVSGWFTAKDTAIIKAFEAENPDVKVNYRFDYGQETLLEQTLAGEGPDVMTVSWAATGDFAKAGLFTDLTPYIKVDAQELALNDIFPQALAAGQSGGIQYSLPSTLGAQGLFLNNDIFQNSGLNLPAKDWDWNEFANVAKRLTRVDSTLNKVQWGWQTNASEQSLGPCMSVVYSYGGSILSPGFGTPTFNTPQTAAGLRVLQKMAYEDGSVGGDFLNGNAAMIIRPSDTVTSWLAKVGYKWQGFALPHGSVGSALMGGAHQMGIGAGSKKKDLAWKFIKYYTGRKGQDIANQFGSVPFPTKHVQQSR